MINLDRLLTWLNQSGLQQTNNAVYQVISTLIKALQELQGNSGENIDSLSGSITGIENSDLLTWTNETPTLPNSKQLLSGANINQDDTVYGQRTIKVTDVITLPGVATPGAPAAGFNTIFNTSNNGHTTPNYIDQDGTIVKIARDTVLLVRNTSGGTINKGQAVDINGSTGQVPTIRLAEADINIRHTEGLALETIVNNGFGLIMLAGLITNIDTSLFAEGNLVYLSTTPGGLTTTPPASPNFVQEIGIITRSHATQGSIEVLIGAPVYDASTLGYWTLLTDGNVDETEFIFASGDAISIFVPV